MTDDIRDPWPRQVPGSNAIGSFTIGVSPIGSIPALDWWDTIISQYGNSPRIVKLIENFGDYMNQSANMDSFFDDMWNIDSAVGYGLDVWGRILQVSRNLEVTTGEFFGFEESGTALPWNQGTFYAGAGLTSVFALSDDAYRQLLLAKAFANICDGSIPAINQLLMTLFGASGNCFVTEGNLIGDFLGFAEAGDRDVTGWGQGAWFSTESSVSPMTMSYVFTFEPTPVQRAIIFNSGVLPKPIGVKASVVIL